jgi:hypothetical protein
MEGKKTIGEGEFVRDREAGKKVKDRQEHKAIK